MTGINVDGRAVTVSGGGIDVGAVDTIPNSVIYQYVAENFASPWPDEQGAADMTVNGLSASTFSNGEDSVAGDGVDDEGFADGPQNIPSNETFGVAFTTAFDGTDVTHWMGVRDGTSTFQIRETDFSPGDLGHIFFGVKDDAGTREEVYTDSRYDDGNVHLVVWNKTGNNVSDFDIYIDDMTTPVSTSVEESTGFDHTAYSINRDAAFWAFNDDGNIRNYKPHDIGLFEFNTSPYSEQERKGIKTRRPEV
jgi:hypothetical protein